MFDFFPIFLIEDCSLELLLSSRRNVPEVTQGAESGWQNLGCIERFYRSVKKLRQQFIMGKVLLEQKCCPLSALLY